MYSLTPTQLSPTRTQTTHQLQCLHHEAAAVQHCQQGCVVAKSLCDVAQGDAGLVHDLSILQCRKWTRVMVAGKEGWSAGLVVI